MMLNTARISMKLPETKAEDTPVSDFIDRFDKFIKGAKVSRPEVLTFNCGINKFRYMTPNKYETIPSVSKVMELSIKMSEKETITKCVASTSRLLIRSNKMVTTIPTEALMAVRGAEIALVTIDGEASKVDFKPIVGIKIKADEPEAAPKKKKRGRKKKVEETTIKLANEPVIPEVPEVKIERSNFRFETADGSMFVVDGMIMK